MKAHVKEEGSSTRERILEAAEELFVRKGFAATSLRAVTQAAGVNLAAVNYHFGSKPGLFVEMVRKRIEPINVERRRLLEEAREASDGGVLTPEVIFDALLRPMAEAIYREGKPDLILMQMVGRSYSEPSEFLREVHREFFADLLEEFLQELGRSFPDLTRAEVAYRMHFSICTVLGSLAQPERLGVLSGGTCDPRDIARLIKELIRFICGGFRSPVVVGKGKEG